MSWYNVFSTSIQPLEALEGLENFIAGTHSSGDITYLLTKFHDDLTINVASRVLTRTNAPSLGNMNKKYLLKRYTALILTPKNAPPPGGHVFQASITIYKLFQDWTINVASRVLTRQMLTPHAAQRTKGDHKIFTKS
ncbi:hypothetical protein DPMN_092268 [Dreissena polymorpha]|uniref:Uncharacterized protein n=1 Tax=Dreissena polymorpha TaxID=45954 RepID=A0A9D4L218_DREPO|nr:hypothetical protein DPMN_092268 [Dreissena polymorpha]